ncbi:DUF4910 domain-containing protein [Thioalkalicoccus limnaeus]|uniref:DUF4910 domain-containing protein n=1 Tax=Thioalkalicoccus limnaeus TaxID=120681 RepID=A0ABV4BDI8_9GAMM
MYEFVRQLYPICRSITGNGVRETLRIIGQRVPLQIREVPTGTKVFDWTIPREWNIRDAWVKDPSGRKIIELRNSNLHVVSYSVPVHKKLSLPELKKHLHSLPELPHLIPYRTSYYQATWGFCLSHNQQRELVEGEYEVFIDSSLEDGHLSFGEYLLKGQTTEEVLLSCHVCHPSLANDNLSGVALATALAQLLEGYDRRYSYRFLFVPGTIGAITWLALNEDFIRQIKCGLVVALVGDRGKLTYKKSRQRCAEIDQAALHVLGHSGAAYEVQDFSPYGYDERQYCSPGIDLAVGSLTRTPYGRYLEYHTSGDNLDFLSADALEDSLQAYLSILHVVDTNRRYRNQYPKCEPQLGRRGLYSELGGQSDGKELEMALLWVLNFSDGEHSILDIAARSGKPFAQLARAARLLERAGLLKESMEREEIRGVERPIESGG